MAILHLYRGIPGSGKSTAAMRMFPAVLRIENDMFSEMDGKYQWSKERIKKAVPWCISIIRMALENGVDVCVCNTFTKKKFVDNIKKIADEYGAKFEVYRCVGNFKNTHNLSPMVMNSFRNAMEDYPGEIIVNGEQPNKNDDDDVISAQEFFS